MGGDQLPAPGWYRDSAGEIRWWDGAAWTTQVAPEPAPAPAPAHAYDPSYDPSYDRSDAHVPVPGALATVVPVAQPAARYTPGAAVTGGAAGGSRMQGVGVVLLGLVLIGIFGVTAAMSQPNGGVIWIGGAVGGIVLVLRGMGAIAGAGSRTQATLHSAAEQWADPWGAHHATKARQREQAAASPGRAGRRSRSKQVPGWAVVACLAVMGLVALWLLQVGPFGQSGAPGAAAPIPVATHATKPAAGKAKATHAATAPKPTAAPWVLPAGFTAVGDSAGFRQVPEQDPSCRALNCGSAQVVYKSACSRLRVHLVYANDAGTALTWATRYVRIKAGQAATVNFSTELDATTWVVDSVECL